MAMMLMMMMIKIDDNDVVLSLYFTNRRRQPCASFQANTFAANFI